MGNALQVLVLTAWFFVGHTTPMSYSTIPYATKFGPYLIKTDCEKAKADWLNPPVYGDAVMINPDVKKADACVSEKILVIYVPTNE